MKNTEKNKKQKEKNGSKTTTDIMVQVAIPCLTIGAQIAIASKFPVWSLAINLAAQPFWFYSTWKSYKKAGQIGILVNTVLFTLVTIFGLVNYIFL